jgi:hypothetical protein
LPCAAAQSNSRISDQHVTSSQEDELLGQWGIINDGDAGLYEGSSDNHGESSLQQRQQIPQTQSQQHQGHHHSHLQSQLRSSLPLPTTRGLFVIPQTQVSSSSRIPFVDDETVRRTPLNLSLCSE